MLPFALRLAEALRRTHAALGVPMVKFADRCEVDRRKLARFLDPQATPEKVNSTSFNGLELEGIDRALAGQGGLSAVLRPRRLLERIVRAEKVMFVVGSARFTTSMPFNDEFREQQPGEYLNAFDLEAVTKLLRAIDRGDTPVHVDIIRAMIQPRSSDYQSTAWYRALTEPTDSRALVSIGNPATCPATEVALALLLGFVPWGTGDVPIRFAWPNQDNHGLFSGSVSELFGVTQENQRGFIVAGERFLVNRNEGTSHGVIACGWVGARPTLCVAGATAPLTTAGASLISSNAIELDFPPHGEAILIHYDAQVTMQPGSSASPDPRVAANTRVRSFIRWDVRARTPLERIFRDDAVPGED